MTTIGSSTITVTLSPGSPSVTLNGSIRANGYVGSYEILYGAISRSESISAAVFGTAATDFKIDNTGTVIGTGDEEYSLGIFLGGIGTVTNSGLIEGYEGIGFYGSKAGGEVRNTGTIFGDGGAAIVFAGDDKVINSNLISGYQGIVLVNGGAVTNTGTGVIYGTQFGILGYGGRIAVVNQATIAGGEDGISLRGGASITNASTGAIVGYYDGIYGVVGASAATVVNAGRIEGTGDSAAGIFLHAAGSVVDNQKTGIILGGVYLPGVKGHVNNQGLITTYGIATGDDGVVVNSGSISSSYDGVNGQAGMSVTNASGGRITADSDGIRVDSGSVSNAGTILAEIGILAGAEAFGPLVKQASSGAAATNITNLGFIDGTEYGVELNTGELTNKGTIIGVNEAVDGYGADVTNSGKIIASGYYGEGISDFGEAITVTNAKSGTITATGSDSGGILFSVEGGVLVNDGVIKAATGLLVLGEERLGASAYNNGVITGTKQGVYISAGYLNNTGTIVATAADGVAVEVNGYKFVNTKTGMVSGGLVGVALGFGDVLTNAGTIAGTLYGIVAAEGGDGITNSGLVTANYFGVALSGGTSAFINTGTVTGNTNSHASGFDGAILGARSTFTNQGVVNHGISLLSAATLVNSGVITYGVQVSSGGTIFNTGTIGAHNGVAIDFTNNDGNLLVLGPSSVIEGSVLLDGGVLELDGNSTGTLNIGSFIGVGTLNVDAGSTWVIDGAEGVSTVVNDGLLKLGAGASLDINGPLSGKGAIDLAAGASLEITGPVGASQTIGFTGKGESVTLANPGGFHGTIAGFKIGDTVDTGIIIASVTGHAFVGSELTITTATHTYTYDFSGKFKNETFSLFNDGDGAGIELVSTKMAFATPSSVPVSGSALPELSTAYTKTAAPAAATGAGTSIIAAGLLSHIIPTHPTTLPTAVTLHG
jgi:hypothetical protein